MDRATATRVQAWDARPVSGGYRGLQTLADAGFSGAVTTGTAWLFLLNGRVVGVSDGTLANFESGDLTAHEAPDPTLPLLFAMQERGGETRAKYYTDDNPLAEVHQTLSEASFTGYVELSDNVLSGDYYVVYYGGRSMSAAFVGSAEKLVTGDEAFRQAAEEVGIYEVIDVELDVRDVPEPAQTDDPGNEADEPIGGVAEPGDASPVDASAGDLDAGDPEPDDGPEPTDAPEESADADGELEAATTDEPSETEPTEPPADEPAPAELAGEEPPADAQSAADQQPASGESTTDATGAQDDPFSQEVAWREARTIPALDPDETDARPVAEDGDEQPAQPPEVGDPVDQPEPDPPAPEPATGVDEERLAELEAAIEAQSETIAELESKLESSSDDAEQLRQEREELRSRLESARAGAAGDAPAEPATSRALDPTTALDQTDLFVRYGTRGGGTLEKAHDGVIDREEVVENLRIDHHTRFEESEVTVDGRPFEAFLTDSLEYRFVNWLVYELLFEIQDTGSQRGLRELFDALPLIDRVEFKGTVTWRDQEAGETHEQTFDVVCRDRMGQALVVANLNDVRDPATGDMLAELIEGASDVAEGVETLGGTFMVTSSFFQPDALETTSEATGGGLLSRDKRWSYVKLSRRRGYHLCLVEARGDDFHVAVPEL